MCTARTSSCHGGVSTLPVRAGTPWSRHPPRAGIHPNCSRHPPPPGVSLETPQSDPLQLPPWVWAWSPPSQIPLNFPLGCGPGDPPQPDLPKLPPWVWAWKPTRHAGIPPLETSCKACWDTTCNACWDTTPPCGQTHICKNITSTNFVCGR